MSKSFALKFRKTRNQLKNIWEEWKYEYMKWLTLKYLSQENKGIAEGFMAHHLPAQNRIHLQKIRYSRKRTFL